MTSSTDEPMEAEDVFAQRQREAAVVAHKDGRSAFWSGAQAWPPPAMSPLTVGIVPASQAWRTLFGRQPVVGRQSRVCRLPAMRQDCAHRGLPGGSGALHGGHPRLSQRTVSGRPGLRRGVRHRADLPGALPRAHVAVAGAHLQYESLLWSHGSLPGLDIARAT